ncbi:Na+/H+ antiporter NhaA [Paludisphaera rhizosphaerae]|uniref:Na+/H+ antiporter NhaA n=1 Tax=Paludisphaera rhizosphaerae TaxID=2711216 RepID=UPI0013EB5EE4|nr:Na+/H+ antiporter NhaA [Paludisphaera rhizosphaerae]
MPPQQSADASQPVSNRMRKDFTSILLGQTVEQALNLLRRNPNGDAVVYFYVIDEEGRLRGVVPTRRLILSPPDAPVTDIMLKDPIAVSESATVREACELFLRYRLLAFPVVDEEQRLRGVVDVDLYTRELERPEGPTVVGRLVQPFVRFMHIESSGGLVLLAATAIALALANSPFAERVHEFWETPAGVTFGSFELIEPLLHWVNDGLMTLFFFVVGLEIKRELVSGELADPRKALLPIVAAFGGMVVPALVYSIVLWGRSGREGWGVPMATDIAFVVGFLTLLGPRVPNGLKVMLLSLAIADDIGAVLVIAAAYSGPIAREPIALAGAGFLLILLLRWLGARNVVTYTVVGVGIWYAVLKSGVHPTVAGVVLGLLTPARPLMNRGVLIDAVGDLYNRIRGIKEGEPQEAPEVSSPAERLEHALHPWVAFVIMPVFALANAGVSAEPSALTTPVALAVAAGLAIGKPIGIVLFSWLSVRIGLTRLPLGVDWRMMIGAGCLGGIGFTMSFFIAGLALQGELLDDAKIGILVGSGLSAMLGCLLLIRALQRSGGDSGSLHREAPVGPSEAVASGV